MTDNEKKNEEFKAEVARGLHPDWVIDPSGKLVFVGEKTMEEKGYFDLYPHGPSDEEER